MISIEGMEFYAYHGCTEEEKKTGIHFKVDVHIVCDLELPSKSDNIKDAINYLTVYKIVSREMQQASNLIEHVGKRVKDAILNEFEQAEEITVRVSKMNPPLGGKVEKVSIVI